MVREGGVRPRVSSQLWKRGGSCEGHLDVDESQQEPKARMEGVESGGGEKGPQAVDGGTSLCLENGTLQKETAKTWGMNGLANWPFCFLCIFISEIK